LTKYRNYKEVYNVDVKRFSIYRGVNNLKDDVVIGDEIDVLVKEIDENGRGVGFYRGYKVLIPKGFINERVRVRIVKISDEGLLGVVVRRYEGTK
jgi:predicted RNA-binding protein with TRAM domain